MKEPYGFGDGAPKYQGNRVDVQFLSRAICHNSGLLFFFCFFQWNLSDDGSETILRAWMTSRCINTSTKDLEQIGVETPFDSKTNKTGIWNV